jgi:hypothetical protein
LKFPIPKEKSLNLGQSIELRQLWIRDVYIPHPKAKNALALFESWRKRVQTLETGHCMFVKGQTGSGKSRLAKFVSDDMNIVTEQSDRTIKRTLIVILPVLLSEKQFAIQILRALDAPDPTKGSYRELLFRIQTLFRECRVETVFVEDFHNMALATKFVGAARVSNVICDLVDTTSTLFVILGDQRCDEIFKQVPPLRRRTPTQVALPYFALSKDPGEMAIFKKLLVEMDKWLPLAESSQLETKENAQAIFLATAGIFSHLIQLLDLAWPHAVNAGRERLVSADLKVAFETLFGDVEEHTNPFAESFVKVDRLDAKGQPFHGWEKV